MTDEFGGKVTDEFVKFKSYPERKRVGKVFRGTPKNKSQLVHVVSYNYSSTIHN